MVDKPWVYITESGTLYDNSVFFIGGLEILKADRNDVTAELENIKEQFNYRGVIKYSSTDRYKLDPAKEWIDFFVNDNRIKFVGLLVDLSERDGFLDYKNFPPKKQMRKKARLYGRLLNQFENTHKIFVKSQSTYGPSRKFKDKFSEDNDQVIYSDVDTFDSSLIQFSDVITGCAYANLVKMPRNLIKKQLIEHLLSQLSTDALTGNFEISNKFKIKSI